MKFTLIGFLLLAAQVTAGASPQSETLYECVYKVQRHQGRTFEMKGHALVSDLAQNAVTYLTLEPPLSAEIPVTARVVLSIFRGEKYFPLTLHPRGDTVRTHKHTRLDGQTSAMVKFVDDLAKYSLKCQIL